MIKIQIQLKIFRATNSLHVFLFSWLYTFQTVGYIWIYINVSQWSLGVTIWELTTGGATPYADIEDSEAVASLVKAGHRLPQETDCPGELWV